MQLTSLLSIYYLRSTMGGANSQAEPVNEEVFKSKERGFTPIYRYRGLKQLVDSPQEGLSNVRDVFAHVNKTYRDKQGIGYVKVEQKGLDEKGEPIEHRSVVLKTYGWLYDTALAVGRSLMRRGLPYRESVYSMQLVGIYSKNRVEWWATDWACALFGVTSVPLYDTLGKENLTYCLKQTMMTTLFLSAPCVKVLMGLEDIGNVRTLVCFDHLEEIEEEVRSKTAQRGVSLLQWKDLVSNGNTLTDLDPFSIPIKSEDVFTFSYTSGTTGPPKGAMITHRNVLAMLGSFEHYTQWAPSEETVHVSYLPLPHLYERSVSIEFPLHGAQMVVYGGNNLKLKEDCQVIRPTIFISVPRIYNKLVDAVKTKFAGESGVKGCLANSALDSKYKSAREEGSSTHALYDKVVFSKVRETLGGNIKMMVSGSAPISAEAVAYMKAMLCCPFVEGYGQTENTVGALYSLPSDYELGSLSQISSGLELRLADIPEMKYTSEDKDADGNPRPRGEIWLRGPQVFKGYYKLDDITRETVTAEGWLRTGDVAEMYPNRSFKIIDRRKNIFKLSQGEYVAPDRVENIYAKSDFVAEAFLHGDSLQSYAVAVVGPNREFLTELANSKGIKGSLEELCGNGQLRRAVLADMNEVGRRAGLNGYELAKNVHLEPKPFVEQGVLTNTFKLIRFEARGVFRPQLERLYKEGELK